MKSTPNTTAAAKNCSVDIPPKEAAVPMLLFAFQSGAVAALFPMVLWCSRGDTVVAVWRLSLLFCSYFYGAACALSAATKASLFFPVLCAVLLAMLVDDKLGQIGGVMIIYLASVVMAGVFGHALAEHRESKGTEKGASAAATQTLALANGNVARVQIELESSARLVVFFVIVCACILGCVIGAAKWFGECRPHGGCTAAELMPDLGLPLFMMISVSLMFGIAGATSHGAVLGTPESNGGIVINGGIPGIFVMCFIFALLGEVGRTVIPWIVLLGLTAFFGYCLRVHDSYMKIMRSHIQAAQVKERK